MLQSVRDFISSIVFAIAATFGINTGTEQPHYDVVERIGDAVEIRQYPKGIAAETTVEASKSDNPRGEAFRAIAGYIFGANKGGWKIDMTAPVEITSSAKKIAMTAPVEAQSSDKVLVMRFFMPAEYSRDPTASAIQPPGQARRDATNHRRRFGILWLDRRCGRSHSYSSTDESSPVDKVEGRRASDRILL
jgi:hypothetical protein